MNVRQLTSRDNPLFKKIRLITSGSRRAPAQWVAAEGIRVLEEVNRAGCEMEAVIFSEHFGSLAREKALLDTWLSKGIRIFQTKERLFKSISSVRTPQGAIALVRVPELCLDEIIPARKALILCACEIQDPGNLGTLIRAAAAAGASFVCTTQRTVTSRNPKVVRSSAGAFFQLPLVEHVKMTEFRDYCHLHAIRVYRTDARKGTPYTEANLQTPCAILLGNESRGVAEEEFEEFQAIRIPMAEGVESLNVAIAGAVILFEAFRQRRAKGMGRSFS